MRVRFFSTFVSLLLCVLLCGCGGGSGSSGISSRVRSRAIATTRNSRALFAIAGIATKATRASQVKTKMGRRAAILLGGLKHTRADLSGYDEELKLYYTATINADGSGRQDLFSDAAQTDKAGDFVWTAPANYGSYPVTFNETYRIGQGEFSGERGTLDITLNDATGNNGTLHIINTNAEGEQIDSRLNLIDGVFTAEGQIQTPSGDTWTETDVYNQEEQWVCRFDFPDGSWGETRGDGSGDGQLIYYGTDGSIDAQGTYDEEGNANLTYDDGSNQTVDVDDWSDGYYDDDWFWDDPIWDEIFSDDSDYGDEGDRSRSRRHHSTSKTIPRRV